MVNPVRPVTGFEAGLSGDEQIRIALRRMIERGGEAQMTDIYDAVEDRVRPLGYGLSDQGRASLRFFVNRIAVQAGYVYPHESSAWLANHARGPGVRDLGCGYR